MSHDKDIGGLRPANDHGRCSICGRPGIASYRPFCSKRCADLDLARWLGGAYVIQSGDEDGEAADSARGEREQADRPDPKGYCDADA